MLGSLGLIVWCCSVAKSHPTFLRPPWTEALPGSSVHGIAQARILEWEPFLELFPSPGDLPNLGMEPISLASPALAGGFFTAKPSGKLPLFN